MEDKDLLLKDLCARLPYGVKVKFKVNEVIANEKKFIYNVDGEYSYITDGKSYFTLDIIKMLSNNYLDEIKPYLFPLSSMTKEQKIECFKGTPLGIDKYGDVAVKDDFYGNSHYIDLEIYLEVIDWLNKNHFDYRNLINKNLAIDCTNLNIY